MLVNADLDYGDEYGDDDGAQSNDEDESKFLDNMMNQYAKKVANTDMDIEAEL